MFHGMMKDSMVLGTAKHIAHAGHRKHYRRHRKSLFMAFLDDQAVKANRKAKAQAKAHK